MFKFSSVMLNALKGIFRDPFMPFFMIGPIAQLIIHNKLISKFSIDSDVAFAIFICFTTKNCRAYCTKLE